VPELFAYVRSHIDRTGGKSGQWFLTGSQDLSLMHGVTESMAGRAAVFGLLPLSFRETGSWNLLRGGFPEVVLRPKGAPVWFNSYIQTYLERDVRALRAVKSLATFRRFLALVAARHGQILNRSDLAAPLGVSVPTVSEWLGVLETTGQIVLVPPFYENFGKRLIKSPKLYWLDSGLVCSYSGSRTSGNSRIPRSSAQCSRDSWPRRSSRGRQTRGEPGRSTSSGTHRASRSISSFRDRGADAIDRGKMVEDDPTPDGQASHRAQGRDEEK